MAGMLTSGRRVGLGLPPEPRDIVLAGRRTSASGIVSRIEAFLLLVFCIGMLLVNQFKWLANVNRATGLVLVIVVFFARTAKRRRFSIPPEVFLFATYIVWSLATGILYAYRVDAVLAYARLLVQELALFFAVVEIARSRRRARLHFYAVLAIASINLGYSFFSGEFGRALEGNANFRAHSLVVGSNYLGFLSLYGVFAVVYLFRFGRSHAQMLWPLALLPGFTALLIFTASRKTFIALVVFAAVWLLLCYRSRIFTRLRPAIITGLVASSVYYTTTEIVMAHTTLGVRLDRSLADPNISTKRVNLYAQGLRLFYEDPVTGVGLGNYLFLSGTHAYAHSDYMETLSTTGLVGFLLHFAIYFLLWRRQSALFRLRLDDRTQYLAGLNKAILVTVLLIAVGVPNQFSPIHWIIMGAILGETLAVGDDLELRSTVAQKNSGNAAAPGLVRPPKEERPSLASS